MGNGGRLLLHRTMSCLSTTFPVMLSAHVPNREITHDMFCFDCQSNVLSDERPSAVSV